MDILIFTLGLTECWINKKENFVYPMAPGTIAGSFDPETHKFHNCSFNEIVSDLREFIELINEKRLNWSF